VFHKLIKIQGIVQGVGFRPFVYRLAKEHHLNGFVLNNSEGVSIEVQGDDDTVKKFIYDLENKAPPLSRIDSIDDESIDSVFNYTDFVIKESVHGKNPTTLVSPDVGTCETCLKELFDPDNRRYLHPFINCLDCGPRFTIIEKLPYDRSSTTMKSFELCSSCLKEFEEPLSQRFHVQPNACPECGPQLELLDSHGKTIEGDPLLNAITCLKEGKIIAIKSLGGFQLAVDATNDEAVQRLRKRKQRDEKPFALMAGDLRNAEKLATFTDKEREALCSRERPIVIVHRPSERRERSSFVPRISTFVAPNTPHLGIMLPYTPLHYLLFYHPAAGGDFEKKKSLFTSLVMTSGNISEEPIIKDNDEAIKRLGSVADAFLTHNRDIHLRCDDSVVYINHKKPSFIRRSRGYAPAPVFLNKNIPQILAMGAELKNTLCITDKNKAFVSQYIGDLENVPTLDYFKEAVSHFKNILNLDPEIIAYDLHPEYLSTKYAIDLLRSTKHEEQSTLPVQHHHAHIASVMCEKGITEPVIGFAMDGTGYGLDETVWGGEVLICTPTQFTRAAHLNPIPLPGGSKAIKEPWRMAFSYLREAFGNDWKTVQLDCLRQTGKTNLSLIDQACKSKINCPQTSSLGRLFDAIASLLNIKHFNAFEGQAPMMLEAMASECETDFMLPYEIQMEELELFPNYLKSPQNNYSLKQKCILDFKPFFYELIKEMKDGTPVPKLARAFHNTLTHAFIDIAEMVRKITGINDVVLSGGSWQNRLLSNEFTQELIKRKFLVFTNEKVPVNDGGISLGQAYIAANVFEQ